MRCPICNREYGPEEKKCKTCGTVFKVLENSLSARTSPDLRKWISVAALAVIIATFLAFRYTLPDATPSQPGIEHPTGSSQTSPIISPPTASATIVTSPPVNQMDYSYILPEADIRTDLSEGIVHYFYDGAIYSSNIPFGTLKEQQTSLDGKTTVLLSQSGVLLSIRAGRTLTCSIVTTTAIDFCLSVNGQQLLYQSSDGDQFILRSFNTVNGVRNTITSLTYPCQYKISPDGNTVAYLKKGNILLQYTGNASPFSKYAIVNDVELLALSNNGDYVYTKDPTGNLLSCYTSSSTLHIPYDAQQNLFKFNAHHTQVMFYSDETLCLSGVELRDHRINNAELLLPPQVNVMHEHNATSVCTTMPVNDLYHHIYGSIDVYPTSAAKPYQTWYITETATVSISSTQDPYVVDPTGRNHYFVSNNNLIVFICQTYQFITPEATEQTNYGNLLCTYDGQRVYYESEGAIYYISPYNPIKCLVAYLPVFSSTPNNTALGAYAIDKYNNFFYLQNDVVCIQNYDGNYPDFFTGAKGLFSDDAGNVYIADSEGVVFLIQRSQEDIYSCKRLDFTWSELFRFF